MVHPGSDWAFVPRAGSAVPAGAYESHCRLPAAVLQVRCGYRWVDSNCRRPGREIGARLIAGSPWLSGRPAVHLLLRPLRRRHHPVPCLRGRNGAALPPGSQAIGRRTL